MTESSREEVLSKPGRQNIHWSLRYKETSQVQRQRKEILCILEKTNSTTVVGTQYIKWRHRELKLG